MTLYAYDAAYQPDLTQVKAHGGIAICRYFVGDNPAWQWKRVTPQQVSSTLTAGLGMVVNYEGTADPPLTRTYGRETAHNALVDIRRCRVPAGVGIGCYMSIDVNTSPARYPAARDYFDGVNDVLTPAGYLTKVYSQGGLIDYLCSWHRVAGKQWLAAPTSWPGYNSSSPNVAMVQLVGTPIAGTDQNVVRDPKALSAYWPAGSPYIPEVDVPLSDSDIQRIRQVVDDEIVKHLGDRAVSNPNAALNAGISTRISADRKAYLESQLGAEAVTNPNALLNAGISTRIGADRRADLANQTDDIVEAVLANLGSGEGGQVTKADVADAVRSVITGTFLTPPAP